MPIEYKNNLYQILGRKGFEHLGFTNNQGPNYWPTAVDSIAEKGGVLQSAREFAAFRIEAGSKDKADFYGITRTSAVFFKNGKKCYVAFDDVADSAKNIILARSLEGFARTQDGGAWVLPKKDVHICDLLKRAERMGRIVEVPEIFREDVSYDGPDFDINQNEYQEDYHEDMPFIGLLGLDPDEAPERLPDITGPLPLKLNTQGANGRSEFGQHPLMRALLLEIAEPYANYLAQNNNYSPPIYMLTAEDLATLTVDEVEVRSIGLGDGLPCDFDGIGICDLLINDGLVRGVRET